MTTITWAELTEVERNALVWCEETSQPNVGWERLSHILSDIEAKGLIYEGNYNAYYLSDAGRRILASAEVEEEQSTTITAAEFVRDGYAEKIVHGECVVLDPFPMENVRVIGIDVLYDSVLAEFYVHYADIVDDSVKVSAYHKFYITWLPQSATTTEETKVDLSANLDHVSTQWVQLHQYISAALGLDFAPEEDIERYGEAIAALQAALAKTEAEGDHSAFWETMYDNLKQNYDGMVTELRQLRMDAKSHERNRIALCDEIVKIGAAFAKAEAENKRLREFVDRVAKPFSHDGSNHLTYNAYDLLWKFHEEARKLQAATDDGQAGEAGE